MRRSGVRFFFALGIAIWLSTSAVGAPFQADSRQPEVQEHFRAALQAQKSGQFDAAVRDYKALLRLQPQLAEAYANLGLIYYLQSKFELSSHALVKAAALKPGLRGVDLFLGMDFVHLHRSQYAVPHLKRAVEEEPTNRQAQVWLGTALWNSGQSAAALRQLRKSAELFPTDIDALYALGEAYQKSAERQLEKLPPKYAQMLRKGIYPRKWNPSGTIISQEGSSDPCAEALAATDQKNYGAAEAKLTTFLAANPQSAKARYLLARTYERLSHSVLSRMFQIDPNSYRVHQLLGRIYEYRWKNQKALAEYRVAEKLRPTLPGIHLAIGEVLWREGRLDPALAELRSEIRLSPYDVRPFAEMGTILVTKHESKQAIPYLDKALQLKPDLLLVHKQLGIAYYQQKDYAEAERELTKALSIDHDGSVHYLLGAAYRDSGRPAEARAEMEQARVIQAASEHRAQATTEDAAEPERIDSN